MNEDKKPNGYWTEEKCLEEAKKYNSRYEFAKEKPGAYEYALEHNLLDKMYEDKRLNK